jgi:hypothetical protein
MKLNKIQALVLTLGVALSSGAMFAGKAYAAPTATSTASFSGTVVPSVVVTTPFAPAAQNYTQVEGIVGLSGGTQSLTANSSAAFYNTNSDTADISISGSTTKPIPLNATALRGVHTLTVNYAGAAPGTLEITTAAASETTPIAPTPISDVALDASGNLTITVTSAWTQPNTGDTELFASAAVPYSASVTATVTPK